MKDIRMEITRRRILDLEKKGLSGELEIPDSRTLPLVPFMQESPVICEIKRCSPSKRNIDLNLDPLKTAERYKKAGIKNISILTEENYFNGSLVDLVNVKTRFPDLSVLRKDFLVSVNDVEISYRLGADSILLITSLLSKADLTGMYTAAVKLGMRPLVEIHDEEDVEKASELKPELIGINSRNLKNFIIDPLQPLRIRNLIKWSASVVYESGVTTPGDGAFVSESGFDGVLVGEAAVKKPEFPRILLKSFTDRKKNIAPSPDLSNSRFDFPSPGKFWKKLYDRYDPGRPFIKICGITNLNDFQKIVSLGADMAGFILARSPRKTDRAFIESCYDPGILKIGVVVLKSGEKLPEEIINMLRDGILDAIQFHGTEEPDQLDGVPGYKAFRIKDQADIDNMKTFPSKAKLIDAFSPDAHGGTGKRIKPELVRKVKEAGPIWLAGGINPENIKDILKDFQPELIDISSGVEKSPGVKDHVKLEELFKKAASYE